MKNKFLYPLLLLALGIASHLQWFNPVSILTFSDWYYWPHEPVKELWSSWGTWLGYWNVGRINIQIPFLLFMSLWSGLAHLNLSYDIATKITFFMPIAIMGFLSPYILFRKLYRQDFVAFLVSLFYGTTTYFLVEQTNHLTVVFIYALAPLLLWAFMRALERHHLRSCIEFVLLYSVAIAFEVRIAFIVTMILVLYLLLFYRRIFRTHTLQLTIAAASILGLNAFWLVATLGGGLTSAIAKVADRGLFGSFLFDLPHALTLTDSAWTGGLPNQKFIMQPVPWYLWFLPFIAFGAFLLRRKLTRIERKQTIFFGLLALVGIFLTKQAAAPLPSAYSWLYIHLPGFSLFREASKFYLVTAIGYAGLMGLTLVAASRLKRINSRPFVLYSLAAIIIFMTSLNLMPLFTSEIGGVFVSRHIPKDYKTLESFIVTQPDFFRTYWTPTYSRWSIYNAAHPEISGVGIVQGEWQQFVDFQRHDSNWPIQYQITDVLKKSFSQTLLNNASVKYVIVPLKDTANDDDFFKYYGGDRGYYLKELDSVPWLKRIDIGTSELAVYENKSFQPHITPITNVTSISDFYHLSEKSDVLAKTGRGSTDLVMADKPIDGATSLKEAFATPALSQQASSLTLNNIFNWSTPSGATLYKNSSSLDLHYDATGKTLNLYTKPVPNPSLNGSPVLFNGSDTRKDLAVVPLQANQALYLQLDDKVVPIVPGNVVNLGSSQNITHGGVYGTGNNLVSNGSFESGLWQPTIGDCHNYDSHAQIGMRLNPDHTTGKQSLELDATRHFACTSTTIAVTAGQTVLSFDYKSLNSKTAGYYLAFNDPSHTVIQDHLNISGTQWQSLLKKVTVPAGATTASLALYAYESDGTSANSVLYDNVSLQQPQLISALVLPAKTSDFIGVPVPLRAGTNRLTLASSDFGSANLIADPSFESGPWATSVGDCNNADHKAKLAQAIDRGEHTDGRQSLRLEATRHNACTSTAINLASDGDHLFSFDFQSPNTKTAGYYIQFNDAAKTVISEQPAITGKGWQHFQKTITVPVGATGASLFLYDYQTDGRTNNTIRYDNFRLTKIPDVNNTYYLITNPTVQLAAPRQLQFTAINPTKQTVQTKGATKPFLLSFAESFNAGWKLYLRPIKEASACTPVSAGGEVIECQSKPVFIQSGDIGLLKAKPIFDDKHIKLNGYANGWMVDPAYIKANYSKDYYRTNADGSLDFNLVVYFQPQSYFYIGMIISGVTLAGCLGFLGFGVVRSRRKKRQAKLDEA